MVQQWKRIDLPILDAAARSSQTYALPRWHWPGWAQRSTQFERVWIYCPDDADPTTSSLSTASVVGRLLTERHDAKDAPQTFNYNYYLLVRSRDGEAFQSGPIPTSDLAHRSSAPHAILDAYGPPVQFE